MQIIPYQVITGNYNVSHCYRDDDNIIPYQVITGNYNPLIIGKLPALDYTIPSDNRELQPPEQGRKQQSIIPYQVITGNYNRQKVVKKNRMIIPYQVITGNYN